MLGKTDNFELDFEEFVDILPCAIYVIRNSVIINCNKAALDIFGYDNKEDVLNVFPYELSPEYQDDGILSMVKGHKMIEKVLSEKSYIELDWMHKRKNGDVFLTDLIIYNKNGILYVVISDKSENSKLKENLRQKDYLYSMLFNNHNSVMLAINAKTGNIIEANKAAIDYYGYSKEQVLSMNISDINILDENDIKKEMELAYKENRNYFQFKHRLADNSHRDVEVHSFPVNNDEENILFSIIYDTGEKVKQKLMFEQLFFASPYAVAILDNEQKIININDNFSEMFQYNLQEIKGKFINNIVSPHNNKDLIDKNLEIIYKGQIVKQEGKRRRKDGLLIDVEVIGYPVIYHQSVIGVYIIYIDISHKQKDNLTGLYNRNYFLETVDEKIDDYIETNEMFSVVVIGIEDFRDINDTLGHIIGDNLLTVIAKRLISVLNSNYLISRIDGDEFGILVSSANKDDLLSLSDKILESLDQPYIISNTKLYLKFNIGISSYPKDGNNSKNLIRFSSAAINQSKNKTNKNISFYNSKISEKLEQRFFLANYLFSAIPNNELSIYYQPIFNIKDKKIVGAEALLRWQNDILGEVPPDKFIPIAEKTGQIISIGEWVIKTVCEQINLWKQKKIKLVPISINISVNQLENINFSKRVINIIKSKNINPQIIELEITERVSSGDTEKIVRNIKELKENGIRISMDDFGTGFSSLGQIDIYELDKLKIDKIFIDHLTCGSKRQNLVKTIIAMAENLNLVTVAEGIETNEQLSYLKGLGCHLGQGFIFSKPLNVEDIEELFKKESIYKMYN